MLGILLGSIGIMMSSYLMMDTDSYKNILSVIMEEIHI